MNFEVSIKEYVAEWKKELAQRVRSLKRKPQFAIVQIGDNEASNRYVRNKVKDCCEVGIDAVVFHYGEDDFKDSTALACFVNKCAFKFDSIIVQLPLPKKFDTKMILSMIPATKDVDGLSGKEGAFIPCTPLGIIQYLERNDYPFDGANALVIGRSELVGKPMARLLLDRNCTVTVAHSHSKDIAAFKENANLIVCAVGSANFLDAASLNENQVVIDIGINFVDGKMVGDVYNKDISKAYISPVPGGVGLLTRCALMENIVRVVEEKEQWED